MIGPLNHNQPKSTLFSNFAW